ncbi:chromatin-remodeling ATPase INO80 isoform X2 [Jatropha curcas]|uniref:chromatin-remodeling ATPase INO80 isoform X2 n=1 Tax=Jatropha curcas TaxID=180498 RepID=UPI0005FC04DC|nr:chromatin-remodeling ATPase INO80 isoform X2 [Jatropha curcas]
MEKRESTYKQGRRKPQLGSGGGANIGGLVLTGGALAVASLVGFALHRGKRRGGNETSSRRQRRKEDQANQGLRFILQNSPPTSLSNSCCSNNGSIKVVATQVDSCELVSTESLVSVENPAYTINCRNEISNGDTDYEKKILLSDESKQDGVKSWDKHGFDKEEKATDAVEENIEKTLSVHSVMEEEKKDDDNLDKDDDKEEEEEEEEEAAVVAKETKEELIFVERTDDDNEPPSIEITEKEATDDTPKTMTDIPSSMNSIIEKEDCAYSNDDYVIEKDKDNLKGTKSSYTGSNAEEIWPAASVEALSQRIRCRLQHSGAKIMEEEEEQPTVIKECNHLDNGKTDVLCNCRNNYETTENSMVMQKEETNLIRRRLLGRYMVVLALMLLLLFTHRLSYLSS